MDYVAPPAKGIAARKRITIRSIAREVGRSREWVGRVMNGYDKSAPLEADIARILGVTREEAFGV